MKEHGFKKLPRSFFTCKTIFLTDSCKLDFEEIFKKIKSKYMKLPILQQQFLDEQSYCLADFLVKTYGIGNVIGMKASKEKINDETALQRYKSVNYLNLERYVFRWDWEKTKKPEEPFPNLIYNEGTPRRTQKM
uniref:DUF4338 domain-containing protein n=1 Tax=Meloidogyne hapla TaxID=6305 RepID=A0A1I8C0G1_MELHA